MNDAALLSKLALLPENFRSEVVDFVDFLMQKAERQQLLAAAPKPVFGSAKGMFRMAPDFDEPLADFEDYMHEMKNLLDTHTLIWFLEGDSSLSSRARQLIQAPAALNFVSMASVWEIAIKTTLNKLGLQRPFSQLQVQLRANGFQLLPITFEDTLLLTTLPFHHRDPFDRLIIAQGIRHELTILFRDPMFEAYGAVLAW